MTNYAARPTYSSEQIARFLEHINLPNDDGISRLISKTASAEEELYLLTQLQVHSLAAVPFENLAIHYSANHGVSLDPDYLFHKIVERGHGGYCMENNCFFGTVLRSLNFPVRSVGARVSQEADGSGKGYTGWSHMVNVVAIEKKRYQVDIGFGANGPTQPLLLEDGHEEGSIEPSRIRLIRDHIPDITNKSDDQRLWIYQLRNSSGEEWKPMYAFTELEFLPQDYEIANLFTSTSPKTIFTTNIIVVKYILDEDANGKLKGNNILFNSVAKRRLHGETEVLIDCSTEEERTKALKDLFGIELKEYEKRGIKGFVTELKGN